MLLYISARLQGNEENYFCKRCLSLQIKKNRLSTHFQLCVDSNVCNYIQVMYKLITEDREFRVRRLKF